MIKNIIILAVTFCSLTVAAQVQPVGRQIHLKTPLGVPYHGEPIQVNKKLLKTKRVPFIEHSDAESSWLGMNFDFQYVKPVFDLLNTTQVPLISRGESHITVVSPPEFTVLSAAGVTIEQVNKIALKESIQLSKVKVVCLGREKVTLEGVEKIVYQIIVKASNLVKIREKIFQLYVKQGGNTALFDPNSFWPHITVGFTSGDIFLEQGVYKGTNVCYRPISLKKKTH